MHLSGLEVVVVGGGVAGLAAAAALVQRGARVTVLEQAGGFLEVGAGIQISPNGARVLAALGQREGLSEIALRSRAVVLREGQSGRPVLRLALPEDGPGFHLIHRADIITLLERAAAGIHTRFVAHVTQITPEGPRPSVTLAGGERVSADLVLGADGLHSVLRKTLNPTAQDAPFFTGQVAWRALIPCAPDAPREAEVFMGPGRHLVSYPLRGGAMRNIVAVEERTDWAQEGWNHPDNPATMRRAFAGFGGPVPDWLAQVDKLWLWGLFRHPVAPCWQAGHAAVLGDAAHPTLPFMAQGANMALEDAFCLVRQLEQAATIPDALARYQMARKGRVTRVVAAATKNARNYHLRTPFAQIAHMALRVSGKLAPNAPLRQFGWIYDHDVTET
ncbi:MAG: FAD-dependent monooxygenase [Roseinatronobacter sp.]|nr:FAD-dependent monooxygenase [Roseinatronobacter sp.]